MKKMMTILMLVIALTTLNFSRAEGDYKELTDILGSQAQIRFVTPTGVVTGFRFEENGHTGFVYQNGEVRFLPTPERAMSSLGFAVSDDGRVVAGTAGMQNLIDGIDKRHIQSLAIWETGREPFFADTLQLYEPVVRGITPDGSIVAVMGGQSSVVICPPGVDQGDPRCHMSISDLYVENGRSRRLNSGGLEDMSTDGLRLLDGNRLIDAQGRLLREYDFLSALEFTEQQGRIHPKVTTSKLRSNRYHHYIEMKALNSDGSVAAGTLTVRAETTTAMSEHYFVRWRADGSLDILDHGDDRYFVKSMSDDGRRVLLNHGYNYYVWTEESGLLSLTRYLNTLNVKFDYKVVGRANYVAMSRDARCLAGNLRETGRSYVVCADE